jgi:hypothetical protein
MAHTQEVWWRPEGRSPFALDPSKPRGPQIAAAIAQLAVIFGGPALGLVGIAHYPFLVEDRVIYFDGLASISLCFSASFLLFSDNSFAKGMPVSTKLAFRAGFGLTFAFLLLGIATIGNGYGAPMGERIAPVVAKHETRQRDRPRRTHYLAVRPWPERRTVVELGGPIEVYDRLDVPVTAIGTPEEALERMPDTGEVKLLVGQGRLGLEWLGGVELP